MKVKSNSANATVTPGHELAIGKSILCQKSEFFRSNSQIRLQQVK